jgi:hypothetical protein
MIDNARTMERQRASYGDKADWLQFSPEPVNGIEVELRLKDVVNDGVVTYEIMRTSFFHGWRRIPRKQAEEILAAA